MSREIAPEIRDALTGGGRTWPRWQQWKRLHPEQERIARRFRQHVRTAGNPRGRIHREDCGFCLDAGDAVLGDAHHPDHARPYVVVWVCVQHHRMLEHGGLRIYKRHVFDYTSLVWQRTGLLRENRPGRSMTLPVDRPPV